jgi:SAM-dependent methyltransferase
MKRFLNYTRRILDIWLSAQRDYSVSAESRPNSASEWEAEYLTTLFKLDRSAIHPLASILREMTNDGDILLEAGCGSAVVSAYLATLDRRIELCDFSPKILDQAINLFALNSLTLSRVQCWDLTQTPYPWADRSIDVTWSSGVLEHWTDEELVPIVREMARISRKRVVSFVPYAGSILYRIGKDHAERNGSWVYGRELPRYSLRKVFESAGLRNIHEDYVWPEQSVEFLRMVNAECYEAARAWLEKDSDAFVCLKGQGYLLLTVGEP